MLALCASPSLAFSRGLLFRYLYQNKLSGTIPAQISALVKLDSLCALTPFVFSGSKLLSCNHVYLCRYLHNNTFSGLIPSEVGKLALLAELYVCASCPIASCTHLLHIELPIYFSLQAPTWKLVHRHYSWLLWQSYTSQSVDNARQSAEWACAFFNWKVD